MGLFTGDCVRIAAFTKMAVAHPLLLDSTWRNQQQYEAAEAFYQQNLAGTSTSSSSQGNPGKSTIVNEIAQARQQIHKVLHSGGSVTTGGGGADGQLTSRVSSLEKENQDLKKTIGDLRSMVQRLENRVTSLEKGSGATSPSAAAAASPAKPAAKDSDDDDEVDLFGSDDSDDEEADEIRKKKLAEYAERKAKKPQIIAKSNLVLDVKPWDDETDMKALESNVRSIEMEGLVWGGSKLVPVGYGIKKLQIMCVIVDDLVSTDDLEDKITGFEDFVQSMDIVAFNKI